VADRFHVAPRSAGDCVDNRGVGPAINYRLKPHWSAAPSVAAVLMRSRAHSGYGPNPDRQRNLASKEAWSKDFLVGNKHRTHPLPLRKRKALELRSNRKMRPPYDLGARSSVPRSFGPATSTGWHQPRRAPCSSHRKTLFSNSSGTRQIRSENLRSGSKFDPAATESAARVIP
jgi:hypothetical protein